MSINHYDSELDFDSVLELYESVGWLAYTNNSEKLQIAWLCLPSTLNESIRLIERLILQFNICLTTCIPVK